MIRYGLIAIAISSGIGLLQASQEEPLVVPGPPGVSGGRIVYAQKTEPKTLNTLIVTDSASKEVIQRLMADLVHINPETQKTEPALAKSWQVSADRRRYTLTLRRGLRFSDGVPCTADDVVFTYECYLDGKLHSSQRDLLILDGRPIVVKKLDDFRVVFELPRPYAVGERLFDSFYILPKHLLEAAYREGRLAEIWSLGSEPRQIAGLGPFRLKQIVPGQRMILERNPYYWKVDSAGHRLPYLQELVFEFAGSEDMQVLRFRAGESDILNRIGGQNYAALLRDAARRGLHMVDAGPGLEFSFLFFNLGNLPAKVSPAVRHHQEFFRLLAFRSAVHFAIDRQSLVRLAYQGYAAPLTGPVPPGNRNWVDNKLPPVAYAPERARQILKDARFRWDSAGRLLSPSGRPVEFTIAVSSTNAERIRMATLIQDDLSKIGMRVEVAPLEFRSLLDRLQQHPRFRCLLSCRWASGRGSESRHGRLAFERRQPLWNPQQKTPATPWEAKIDRLMRSRSITPDYAARKRLFDRVQEIVMENLPMVPLVSAAPAGWGRRQGWPISGRP